MNHVSFFFSLKENGEEEAKHDFLSQEFLMNEETSSEEESDTEESPGKDNCETMDEKTDASSQEQNVSQSLRQRTSKRSYEVECCKKQCVLSLLVVHKKIVTTQMMFFTSTFSVLLSNS